MTPRRRHSHTAGAEFETIQPDHARGDTAPEGETDAVHGDAGEKVTILDVGRAALEISNPAQVEMIDRVEVGRRVSPHLRVAFEVTDAASVTDELVDAGAELLAPPTATPRPGTASDLAVHQLFSGGPDS